MTKVMISGIYTNNFQGTEFKSRIENVAVYELLAMKLQKNKKKMSAMICRAKTVSLTPQLKKPHFETESGPSKIILCVVTAIIVANALLNTEEIPVINEPVSM